MPGADINFLLWRLRSTPALEDIPILAITANDFGAPTIETLRKEFFGRRGVEMILKKPLDIDTLFVALQKYCALDYKSWKERGADADAPGVGRGGR